MTAQKYIILVERKDNGEYLLTRSNNPTQRVKRLKDNVRASNGQAGSHLYFERFDMFKGCDAEKDVTYRVFKEV